MTDDLRLTSPAMSAQIGLRDRAALFRGAFAAGVARLNRVPRPAASPTLTIFPNWAQWAAAVLIGLGLTLAGMAYVDPIVQSAQGGVTGYGERLFRVLTDFGKSGWFLVSTGVATLLILAVVAPARAFADRVALALALRLSFLFIAVAGSGLIITIVKRIIGRGRPWSFETQGSLYFDVMAWKASYASFPSGHSQTAFSIAVALGCLFPRARAWLIAAAVVVAASRVIVDAHYFTDIVVGSLWGAWFALMTREWFARRGLVFSPGPDRRPFPMSARRAREAAAAVFARFRS